MLFFCILLVSIPAGFGGLVLAQTTAVPRPYTPSYVTCYQPVNGLSCFMKLLQPISYKTNGHVTNRPRRPAATNYSKQENIPTDTAHVTDPILKLALGTSPQNAQTVTNSIFSPFSVATVLTLLMDGSNRRTYSQIRSALGYSKTVSDLQIYQAYRAILHRLKKLDATSMTINVANGLFTQETLLPLFHKRAEYYFGSQVQQLDLSSQSHASANQINSWVSRQTNGKINNILFSLPPGTRLVAANAIYLKADWAVPFDQDSTREAPFYVTTNETISVQTMMQQNDVRYVEDPHLGCKMVALPYKGDEVVMYLVLPTEEADGLESLVELEGKLADTSLFNRLVDSMTRKSTIVQLPRFRLQQKLNLKPFLNSIGMTDLFSPESADLSRMMSEQGVAVSDVVHQAYIDVTETGTEAAAATLFNLNRNGPSRTFKANRPFLFFITDTITKAVLFSGRVVRPQRSTRRP